MKIFKIRGKDEAVIKQQIQKEYGESAIILSTHQEREEGMFGFFKKPQYAVTIAVEEPKKSEKPVEEVTHSMDELRAQMDLLRKEIYEAKAQPITRKEQPKIDEQDSVLKLFEDRLIEEGVHPEVIAKLLNGMGGDLEIDGIVRMLYTKITSSFKATQCEEGPQKVFFIGPTGVGKTTTIAKLTADKVLNEQKKVTLLTADTYRIAAIEQLRTYAEILDVPIEIVYEDKDLKNYLSKWENKANYIFIDTAGRSHKNVEQMIHMQSLLAEVKDKKVYLVLNMNTQFQDLKRIITNYELLTPDFEVIVTKSDETDVIGNLLNIAYYTQRPIAYLTIGQSVPDDFIIFNPHEYTKDLLGRISYE